MTPSGERLPPLPRSRMPAADRRRAELARIHIGRKALGLDDDAYRAMLRRTAGVRSAADLDQEGRAAVLDRLRANGAFVRGSPTPPPERGPLLRKIHMLLGERPVAYAEAILRRQMGDRSPARLEWAKPLDLRKVVAALNYDQRRRVRRARGASR